MQPKRVLCAVDFSKGSDQTVAKACEIAHSLHEAVELVHVYRLPMLPLFEGDRLFEDRALRTRSIEQLSGGAPGKLEQIRANVEAQGLRCTTTLLGGDPATQLITCSQQPETEVLVIGCHGHSGVRRRLMGSVAERVMRHACSPVLTVRTSAN